MKSVSILVSHWKNWKWLPIAISSLKQYGFSGIPYEIVVADNSPGHPSIKTITETELGKDVKVITGDPEMPSHGQGYSLCYEQSEGSHIFTIETDSMATRHGWFEPYIKASPDYDYIGPHMNLAGGIFIHPCGALAKRGLIEEHKKWMAKHKDWVFVPGAAVKFGVSEKPYHVIAHKDWLAEKEIDMGLQKEIDVWKRAGTWQCMISWDDDNWHSYPQRNGIRHLEPRGHTRWHLRIGYEPGQHLSGYAQQYAKCLNTPCVVDWIPGWEGRQAAQSTVFGGFKHVWCGTSAFCDGIAPVIRDFKARQMNECWQTVPEEIRKQIEAMEAKHESN